MGDHVQTEAPVSTSDGVRAADVTLGFQWPTRKSGASPLFLQAPEICVEVLSPSNSPAEMAEKMALYFDVGADEVWLCETDGTMRFHAPTGPIASSALCPNFPASIPG